MGDWGLKIRKLRFKLTPPRFRSALCRDNPWLCGFDIGEWSYGDPKVLGWGSGARLTIGRFCSIAGGVTIFLDYGEHNTEAITTYPMSKLLGKDHHIHPSVRAKGDVVIGNDVWIGDQSTILSGVQIGNGAVIGARSVVAKNVPPYSIFAGNPARLVRLRFKPEQIFALEQIAWWNWRVEKIQAAAALLLSPAVDDFIARYL
jgi:acetyltransferase-like isoleucine patch superfamily enzyme